MSGIVSVAEMPRLLDTLDNPAGSISYSVRGGEGRQGVPFLDVTMTGSCELRCQRCLNAMAHAIQLDTRLLLRDQAGLDALDEGVAGGEEEEFDSILADERLDVLSLLEEEILLSLPIAPRHEPGVCQAADGGSGQKEATHPFAALANLKVVK
ncbi:MAG TPA: YceD family protein [Gallionella sp.]|nr:YceD family protein [Gallionella sp.]